jgi:hypothetical protein
MPTARTIRNTQTDPVTERTATAKRTATATTLIRINATPAKNRIAASFKGTGIGLEAYAARPK